MSKYCKVCHKPKSIYNHCVLCNACRLKAIHCDLIDFEKVTKKKLEKAMRWAEISTKFHFDNIC
jgi:hypothetical protein